MKCPECNVELVMSERLGVEIDYCPTCRGVWLDRGELDKVIERSSKERRDDRPEWYETRDEPRETSHAGQRRAGPEQRRRKSFLGDLFDFD